MSQTAPGRDRPPRSGEGTVWLAIAAGLALAALLGWLLSEHGDRLDWSRDGPRLAFVLLLLGLVVSSLSLRRSSFAFALRSLLGWVLVGAVCVAGYTWRAEISDLGRGLFSGFREGAPVSAESATGDEERSLAIRQADNGHFYVDARINGAEIRLMIDTGATTTVLNRRQAERAAIFVAPGDFVVRVRTGSGMATAAEIDIAELELGEARFTGVPALVMDTPGGLSVLGLNALRRFRSYDVRDGVMTLRW